MKMMRSRWERGFSKPAVEKSIKALEAKSIKMPMMAWTFERDNLYSSKRTAALDMMMERAMSKKYGFSDRK
jgi:hypothetical protein